MTKVSEFIPKLRETYFDVDTVTDTKGFINPLLVDKYKDLLPGSSEKLESFFTAIMNGDIDDEILNKLVVIKEENAFHLGYGRDTSQGHGPDKDVSKQLFKQFNQYMTEYPVLNELGNAGTKLMSLTLFVKHFSYDSISDLTMRIIQKELYDFTINLLTGTEYAQYVNDNGEEHTLTYWSIEEKSWVDEKVKVGLYLEGDFTILVPDKIVELNRFSYNPDNYINSVIVPRIINEGPKLATKVKKSDVKKNAVESAGSQKLLIQESMKTHPNELKNYLK